MGMHSSFQVAYGMLLLNPSPFVEEDSVPEGLAVIPYGDNSSGSKYLLVLRSSIDDISVEEGNPIVTLDLAMPKDYHKLSLYVSEQMPNDLVGDPHTHLGSDTPQFSWYAYEWLA